MTAAVDPHRDAAIDDNELALAAARGDKQAFAQLYERHADHVLGYLRSRVGSWAVAEDLTSETFIRAYTRIATFRPQGGGFVGWIFTIARNLAHDLHKSSGHRREVLDGELPEITDDRYAPEAYGIAQLDRERLHACLEQLTPDQHECIRLRFFAGLSLDETAAAMGRNVNSIKQLQFRAVRQLSALHDRLDRLAALRTAG